MRLNAPKQITFWISVVLALLGLLGNAGVIGALAGFSFWLVLVGFVLLALGTMLEGL